VSYLSLNKKQLANHEFSFHREFLEANEIGAYSSSTVSLCNTRKYHGMLVLRQPYIDDSCYVMLAALDESINYNQHHFLLGTHQYAGLVYPQGFNLMKEFELEKIPTWIYELGEMKLKKELLLVHNENRLLIRYTYLQGKENVQLKLEPFTAFRNYHSVGKIGRINHDLNYIENGASFQMYSDFYSLHMQVSKEAHFMPTFEWNYDNEYLRELDRGYDFKEDLLTPGYFSMLMHPGEEIVFSVGTSEMLPSQLKDLFASELKTRKKITNFESALDISAAHFISKTKKGMEITAGFHWFGRWGRDTFISLPGLTLSRNKPEVFKSVMDSMLQDLQDGLLSNIGVGEEARYNSADASLWFFWSLQKYAAHSKKTKGLWLEFGAGIKEILESYRKGTWYNIHMTEDGLLWGGQEDVALTWMDAMVDGKPVTPRAGYAVDLNALWYNAVCFSIELATDAEDKEFVKKWTKLPALIKKSFKAKFYSEEKGYLADCIHKDIQILNLEPHTLLSDWSIRPNQIFAISLPFPLIEGTAAKSILKVVEKHLLTPRGLRTLSRADYKYKGIYSGNQEERDLIYHQGIVWPWLLGHFCEAYLKIYGEKGVKFVTEIYRNFEEALTEYGVGSIAEIYNAEAPFKAAGTISQAWSVAELLRIKEMID